MSKTIIFTGSEFPDLFTPECIMSSDYVIAADSGFEVAKKFGVNVNLCIGDFDSTREIDSIERQAFERYPRDKDDSDTSLALKKSFSLGYEEYVLVGGGGGRLDHLLDLYSLFSRFKAPLTWYTHHEICHRVETTKSFHLLSKERVVSFVPCFFKGESTVTCRNLVWPLEKYKLTLSSISLSNRTTDEVLSVLVQGDPVFVCFPQLPDNG